LKLKILTKRAISIVSYQTFSHKLLVPQASSAGKGLNKETHWVAGKSWWPTQNYLTT